MGLEADLALNCGVLLWLDILQPSNYVDVWKLVLLVGLFGLLWRDTLN